MRLRKMIRLEEGTFLGFALVILCFILFPLCMEYTKRARLKPKIRTLPAITRIEEVIERAVKVGRPVMYIPGVQGLSSPATLAGLSILGYTARRTAKFGADIIVPVRNPLVQLSVLDILKESYLIEGKSDIYEAKVKDEVVFLSTSQFGFASGALGLMERREIAANLLLGGFQAESMILAEAGNRVGAIQIAGTDNIYQIPFFFAACDYVLIGEELFAAGAYLSEDPIQLGTIQCEDYIRFLILAFLILGIILATAGVDWFINLTKL